jgi:hypothetical protein
VHPRKLLILQAAGVARSAGIAVVGYSFGTHRFSRNPAGLSYFVRTASRDVHPDRMARGPQAVACCNLTANRVRCFCRAQGASAVPLLSP